MNRKSREIFTRVAAAAALSLTGSIFAGCASGEIDAWTLLNNKCSSGEVTPMDNTKVAVFNRRLNVGETLLLGCNWLGCNKLTMVGNGYTDLNYENANYPASVLLDGRIIFPVYEAVTTNRKVSVDLHWVDSKTADAQVTLNCTDGTKVAPVPSER